MRSRVRSRERERVRSREREGVGGGMYPAIFWVYPEIFSEKIEKKCI